MSQTTFWSCARGWQLLGCGLALPFLCYITDFIPRRHCCNFELEFCLALRMSFNACNHGRKPMAPYSCLKASFVWRLGQVRKNRFEGVLFFISRPCKQAQGQLAAGAKRMRQRLFYLRPKLHMQQEIGHLASLKFGSGVRWPQCSSGLSMSGVRCS